MGRRPGFDILLALKGVTRTLCVLVCPPDVVWRRGFPKGIFRLRVSSVLKYAFAWNVKGSRPVVTKDVRYSACSPVKGPSFLHTAGVNDGWLFNQRGSTVRVSRTATPCMVYPPVVRYSPTRSGQHGVHDHTPNTKSSHHHGFPSNHTPNIAGWSGMHRPSRHEYQHVRLCT